MKALNLPADARLRPQTFGVGSDYTGLLADFVNTNGAQIETVMGGVYRLTSDANNELAQVRSLYKVFQFRANKPISAQVRTRVTIDAGDNATQNWFFGLFSTTGSPLQDDGAGLIADWHGAAFTAVDGSDTLRCETSYGTTSKQSTLLNAADKNNLSGTAYGLTSLSNWRELRIDVKPVHLSVPDFEVYFMIGGIHVAKHRLVGAAAGAMMYLEVSHKHGNANTDVQTTDVDYLDAWQTR